MHSRVAVIPIDILHHSLQIGKPYLSHLSLTLTYSPVLANHAHVATAMTESLVCEQTYLL
jgi:hypothetical protein